MALTSKVAKALAKNSREAQTRTNKFLNLPGYDDITEMSQKEVADEIAKLKKIEDSRKLTAREEKSLDRLMNRRIREGAAEKPEGMSKAQKPKALSPREKKDLQESLEFKKGGAVMKKKKYMAGGLSTAATKSGRTMPATGNQRVTTMPVRSMPSQSEEGLAKAAAASKGKVKMAKGGMSTANCGASMKPAQKAKK
jgi:hypothetical protein